MKKQYIIPLLCIFCFCFSIACEDLDEKPVGSLNPEGFFKSPDDVMVAINGGYAGITSEEFWGRKLPLALLLRGDMCTIGDPTTSAARIDVDQFNVDPANGMVGAFWPKGYEAIAALNTAIAGARELDVPEEEINPIMAEAMFLRAFIYYQFVRLFGSLPYVDMPFTDPNSAYTYEESSAEEVYVHIIEDLQFAKQWLPDDQGLRSRPSKGSAAGMLASVFLTLERHEDAYDEAKYVIDNKAKFGYGLTPEFQNLFDATVIDNDENAQEILFAVDFNGNDEYPAAGNYTRDYLASVTGPRGDNRFPQGEGWSVAVPSMEVYNTWDGRDYRKAVSFDTVAVMGDTLTNYQYWDKASRGVARPHIAKYFRYFGKAGLNGRDSDNNYIVMRYAEVLLIAAEALNEVQGVSDEAVGYVNEVRQRARRELDADPANDRDFPADITAAMTDAQFRDLVIDERRLELAFEFGRWYDLKRRDMGTEAFAAGGLEPQPNFNVAIDYLLPKPQSDININPNINQNDY